jgi:hypothetical protein
MTPEYDGLRTRTLLAACGFGLAALAAAGALLLLGRERRDPGPFALRPPSTPARNSAASSVPESQAQKTAARRSEAIAADGQGGRLFSPTSIWNARLSAATPQDPSSAALVSGLVAEVQQERSAGSGPGIAADSSSPPIYRVGAAQSRVRIRLDDRGPAGAGALQQALAAVPVPADAKPGARPARQMTIWQPSTETLWELDGARKLSDGWHAAWGGAIRRASTNPGYYTGGAWPGATRNWGATTSGLPAIGGTILLDDLRAGRIDHALALSVPSTRAGVFAWPAQRTDGTGAAGALPEGARLRLDPTLDVRSLGLPRVTRMIALAAQRYGIVVRGQADDAISFLGENPSQFAVDPYRMYFQGRTPQALLARFPWDRLQVMAMRLCTAAPCSP